MSPVGLFELVGGGGSALVVEPVEFREMKSQVAFDFAFDFGRQAREHLHILFERRCFT
jgi:hypothetical protein